VKLTKADHRHKGLQCTFHHENSYANSPEKCEGEVIRGYYAMNAGAVSEIDAHCEAARNWNIDRGFVWYALSKCFGVLWGSSVICKTGCQVSEPCFEEYDVKVGRHVP